MKSIIVGTAGHIDHGKTALVKALTGIDADRLQEEKRRGITIDLGFAHMELVAENGELLRLGFVDVPGHERFVRNMLAGIGGIDLVLLVIAADEAIKPQTREHFDILQLLGVGRGITVLTKSDAVDADTLDVVRLEVEEYLRGTFLDTSRSPMLAVSSVTGAGLEELKGALVSAAANVQPRDCHAIARLPIDRVFTMKGFGTVVTGTLVAGTILREDELEVFPAARRLRVRGVQVHGHAAEAAVAGQRTALNLAGARTEDLSRGMTLAAPATFETTRRADVFLRLLASAERSLKDRGRVHFHSYSMETVAEVGLRGKKQISPGDEAIARIKLPGPVLLLPGDRFIIRQFSPVVTIGGGTVLDAAPMLRISRHADFDMVLAEGNAEAILTARVKRRQHAGISMSRLISETGWARAALENHLKKLTSMGVLATLGEVFVHAPALEALKVSILNTTGKFHQKNPLADGMNKEELRSQVEASPDVFEAVAKTLMRENKVEILGDVVRLSGHRILMKDEEAESKDKIADVFAAAGLKVPALHEVIAGLKVDKTRAQKIVTLLLRDKVLIKVSDGLVFHRSALEELRRKMTAYKSKSPTIDVPQFKDLADVTRKYAIPLLEYLDREHITKRIGDARQIL
ncbi:MAG: selenocysteine-specific translation elongation factor [Candidatus Sulfotelmatobacter sp.]